MQINQTNLKLCLSQQTKHGYLWYWTAMLYQGRCEKRFSCMAAELEYQYLFLIFFHILVPITKALYTSTRIVHEQKQEAVLKKLPKDILTKGHPQTDSHIFSYLAKNYFQPYARNIVTFVALNLNSGQLLLHFNCLLTHLWTVSTV